MPNSPNEVMVRYVVDGQENQEHFKSVHACGVKYGLNFAQTMKIIYKHEGKVFRGRLPVDATIEITGKHVSVATPWHCDVCNRDYKVKSYHLISSKHQEMEQFVKQIKN